MSKKSIAKANGLKSTFKLNDNEYFMTSFGKGNQAQEEKYIEGMNVRDIRKTFTATMEKDSQATVEGKVGQSDVQLPLKDKNQLQAKSVIEEIFFGKTFEDNIHIQIAYNVMDIKKLFSVYANNIIYAVNNLLRMDYDKDFVGMFNTMNSLEASQIAYAIYNSKLITRDKGTHPYYYIDMNVWSAEKNKSLSKLRDLVDKHSVRGLKYRENISNCIVNQLKLGQFKFIRSAAESYESIKDFGLDKGANYFSDVFADNNGNINLDYIYESLRLLGTMRQTAFHSYDFKGSTSGKSKTYTLFEIDKKAPPETRAILDAIAKNKIDTLNNNFVNTSTVNLNILFSAYPEADKKELIKSYYNFAVRKAYKNIGFSVKTLREIILAEENDVKYISGKEYDSVRQKLYSLLDFVIYTYYLNNEERALDFITNLRQLNTSKGEEITLEDKKLSLYKTEATMLWNNIKSIVLEKVILSIDKCKSNGGIKSLSSKIDESLKSEILSSVQASSDLSYFAKAIYCICAFLDGKEINMFLDSLINSFDNIVSLNEASEYANCKAEFADNYSFFNNCSEKADELRFIKSIARMNKGKKATKDSKVNIRSFQYFDAAAILGETDTDKITRLFKLNEKSTKEHTVDHTFRNFIINNVINSNRYNYVIRFVNPTSAREIMKNKALVSYAISDIDDKQIIRYCESTQTPYSAKSPDFSEMRSALVGKLLKVDFDTFAKVSKDSKEAVEKERLKALVGLYLTIIYLITKSLVRINTSYSIAFSIFERDCVIMDKKAKSVPDKDSDLIKNISFKKRNITDPEANYFGLTQYFINRSRMNDRVKNLVLRNQAHYNNETFRYFRNNVEHLAVVSKLPIYVSDINKVHSYFDLYHYLMLRTLKDGDGTYPSIKNDATLSILDIALEHQSAWKDFLYGILSPFAYNPARYINLACKDKFISGYGK